MRDEKGEEMHKSKGNAIWFDEAADKAVSKIRTPKDKARATRDLADDRLDAMDKALQKQ